MKKNKYYTSYYYITSVKCYRHIMIIDTNV